MNLNFHSNHWWKSRTALISGGLAVVVLSAACVQLAPMARSRFASPSDVADTTRAAPAVTRPATTSRASTTGPRTAVVTRGPIANVLTLNGRVSGTDELPVGFTSAATVQSVSVKPGQVVEPGQLLAEADSREITRDLAAARTRLETSLVRVAQSQAQAGARSQDAGRRAQADSLKNQRGVIEAEVALRRAQDDLERVKAGAPETDQRAAEAGVATAQAALERAQADLARISANDNIGDVQAAEQEVASARITLQRAEADLARLQAGANPAEARAAEREVLAAQSDYEKARTDLDRLTRGPDPQAVGTAQRDVDRAQSSLRSAQSARVDTPASRSARDADIRRAQGDLDQAQARLDALNQPPRQVDVDLARNKLQSAQLALDAARDKLDRVQRGPDATAIQVADLTVSRARSGLAGAETKLAAAKAGATDAQIASARAAVQGAQVGVTSAQAKLTEVNSHPTPAELRDAQDRVVLGQSGLTRAVADAGGSSDSSDTSAYDFMLLEKTVEQDRGQVDALEKSLEATRLRAPSGGVVTSVLALPGDPVPSGRPVISLARAGDPVIQADLTPADAARLSVGQAATLKIDGLDDVNLTGSITAVGDRDTGLGRSATISVAWPDARVAYGAQAEITFSVDERDNALTVPEKAVRSNGVRKYVEYMAGSVRRTVDVQVGITSGGLVEVTKGLSEGQTVLVRP